jgi:maltose O-acetyltransferase
MLREGPLPFYACKVRRLWLAAYYGLFRHLPRTAMPGGRMAKRLRVAAARRLLSGCGQDVNVEHGAEFGNGVGRFLGDRAAIGIDCRVYPCRIGRSVLMGPEVLIFDRGHEFSDPTRTIGEQGDTESRPPEIGDEAWIGARAIILPGVTIGRGAVVGAGSVVTKDVAAYTVAAGNPAREVGRRDPGAGQIPVPPER